MLHQISLKLKLVLAVQLALITANCALWAGDSADSQPPVTPTSAPITITPAPAAEASTTPAPTDKAADLTATIPCKITIQPVIKRPQSATAPATLKKLVMVRIDGEIANLGPKAGRLYQLGLKEDVLGVVICLNSPGGQAGASELMQRAMDFVKRQQKPVFIHIEDLALSGGYLIACAGSKLYAGNFSEIGSIGVIAQPGNPEDIRKHTNDLVVGKHKRYSFTPEGELTEESKKDLAAELEKIYRIFRQDVSERRQIPVEQIDSWEANTFLGQEALSLGLIDAIGSLDQVIMDLKAEIKKQPAYAELQQLSLVDEEGKELAKI